MIEYREIPGCPGYRVGSDGSVWSRWRACKSGPRLMADWHRLKPGTRKCGHKHVCLREVGSQSVHRLVLEAFVGPCPEGMECRHLNDDPADNALPNLAWGTRTQNANDRKRNGRQKYGPAHWNYKHGKYAETRS